MRIGVCVCVCVCVCGPGTHLIRSRRDQKLFATDTLACRSLLSRGQVPAEGMRDGASNDSRNNNESSYRLQTSNVVILLDCIAPR